MNLKKVKRDKPQAMSVNPMISPSHVSGSEAESDYDDDDVGPIMHKVCVKSRPLVMIGTINIRAMISILAKARLESISVEGKL